ncbi:MAG: efflux RND transporter permease subunit [Candidatus Geothermincolia bacterium]
MRVFAWIANQVKRFPWTVIILCLILSAFLGSGLLFLKGDVTYTSLLPKNFSSITALENLNKRFGGISYETILITAPDVTDNNVVQFLLGLEDFINKDPGLGKGQVVTIPGEKGPGVAPILQRPIPNIQDYLNPFVANVKQGIAQSPYDIQLSSITKQQIESQTGKDFKRTVREEYLSVPEVRDQMIGKHKFLIYDPKTDTYPAALIMMKTNANLSPGEQIALANNLEKMLKSKLTTPGAPLYTPGLKVYVSGDPTLARDFNTHIEDKTLLLGLIALGFVVAVIFFAFRRITDALLTLGVVLLSVVWTFGFTGWVGVPYSVAAIAIMPLLLGHALTFVVPYTARYYEEMEHEFRSVKMVGVALIGVGVGIFLCMITSVLGFLVFEFSVLPPLKNFGLTAAAGTFFAFVLTVVMLPAMMVVRDRVQEKGPTEKQEKFKTNFDGLSRRRRRGLFARATDRGLGWFTLISTRHSIIVIIVGVFLISLGLLQAWSLTTDSDLRKLVPRGLPSINADFTVEKYFGGQQTDTIMVTGDVMDPANLKLMADLEAAVIKDPRNVYNGTTLYPKDAIVGLPDALASANGGKLPATREEAEAAVATAQLNGGYIVGGLLSEDRKAGLISLNGAGAQTPEVVNQKFKLLNKDSKEVLSSSKLGYELGGITPLTKDLTKNIIPTETWSSILSLALCGLLLVLIFWSVPYGIITLTVAIAGVAAQIGFLVLMDYPLDVVTSLSSALVIGIGSNFGIFFTHRYLQEMKKGDVLPAEAIKTTMMNLGRANVVAAIATVGAFLIVLLSGIVPLVRFAAVTAFGVGVSLIAALTFMPALIYRLSWHHQAVVEKAALEEA